MSLKNLSVKIKVNKLFRNKLKNKKINKIYKNFEKSLAIRENFIVGVSGGSDSLALAFLAKIYSIKNNINPKFFIVNHKLRRESTEEAKIVKKVLKKFYIKSEILTWKGTKPRSNIQSLARKKRYDLLFAKCNKLNIKNVLLGHHQDDLFENFFIRMSRGSGLKGLVSFDKINKINGINILRPLLNFNKNDLIFIAKNIFNFYVQDPTNEDEKYQRIKIRKYFQGLEKNGLDKEKIIKTIKNLKYSNNAIDFYVEENLKKNSFFLAKKNKIFLDEFFFLQPYEVVFRAFCDAIKKIGQKYYSPRGKKVDKIIDEIKNKKLIKGTLGGCIIEKVNETVIISKEH